MRNTRLKGKRKYLALCGKLKSFKPYVNFMLRANSGFNKIMRLEFESEYALNLYYMVFAGGRGMIYHHWSNITIIKKNKL